MNEVCSKCICNDCTKRMDVCGRCEMCERMKKHIPVDVSFCKWKGEDAGHDNG